MSVPLVGADSATVADEFGDDPAVDVVGAACATPAALANAAPKPTVTAPAPNQLEIGRLRPSWGRPLRTVVDRLTLRLLSLIGLPSGSRALRMRLTVIAASYGSGSPDPLSSKRIDAEVDTPSKLAAHRLTSSNFEETPGKFLLFGALSKEAH
jgi:hypothetical protein